MAGSRWSNDRGTQRGADYDARWERLEAAGHSIHGEADFVERFDPTSVLDAGCGTGRVGIELSRRGVSVVGVDLEPRMLAAARAKAPDLTWVEADLVDVDLDRRFDVVVMAGNVMIFLTPGTEAAVVANMARHLRPGGHLIAGFELGQGYHVDHYDADGVAAGLIRLGRYRTWDGDPWIGSADYAVSVHRRPPDSDQV